MRAGKLIKRVAGGLSPQKKRIISRFLDRSSIGRAILRWYAIDPFDVFIISFPKCGRTWLCCMLGKAMALHFNILDENCINLEGLARECPEMPYIKPTHDENPHLKIPSELIADKLQYRGKKVILLIRDVRDVLVSNFFQGTKREKFIAERDIQDISSYIHYERGSVDTFITFYNIWDKNQCVPSNFLLVKYEDLHLEPHRELEKVFDFLGLSDISDGVINEAVEYARFDNMRRMEARGTAQTDKLKPGDKSDLESYKTRKGKVGGFEEYLSKEDIEFINRKMEELSPFYGYR